MINNINDKRDSRGQRMTIKDLPECERPDEKCITCGPGALSDAELLAVIIRTGSLDERSVELAYRVLNMSQVYKGANVLSHLQYRDLLRIKGIGRVKAAQIICIAELAKRINRSGQGEAISFKSSAEIAAYFMEDMRHLEHEELRAVYFDGRGRMLFHRVVFVGSLSSAMLEPREIIADAIKGCAESVVVLHNHPSGNPQPSQADIGSTLRLKTACDVMGIRLRDHIVIGELQYVSMKENDLF